MLKKWSLLERKEERRKRSLLQKHLHLLKHLPSHPGLLRKPLLQRYHQLFFVKSFLFKPGKLICLILYEQAAGPPKKGKPASAPSAKSKKASDTKEIVEMELSVCLQFYIDAFNILSNLIKCCLLSCNCYLCVN